MEGKVGGMSTPSAHGSSAFIAPLWKVSGFNFFTDPKLTLLLEHRQASAKLSICKRCGAWPFDGSAIDGRSSRLFKEQAGIIADFWEFNKH